MSLLLENLLIKSSPDGIVGFDNELTITVWNPRMEQLFGVHFAFIVGSKVYDDFLPRLLSEENKGIFREALRGRSGTLKTIHLEESRYTFYEITYFPLIRENGTIAGGMVTLKELDLANQHGQLSSRTCIQFQGVLEKMADAFMALDENWHITYTNHQAAAIFHRTQESLIGKHLWTEFPEGVGHPFQHACYCAVAENRPLTLEAYYQQLDVWFENRLYPLTDGLLIFFADISKHKKKEAELKRLNAALEAKNEQLREREAALRDVNEKLLAGEEKLHRSLRQVVEYNAHLGESERRFKTLANHAPVMIWMTDPDGKNNYLNQVWLDFTGRSLEEDAGDGWTSLLHPDDARACLAAFYDGLARREPVEVEYRLRRHDGQYRWVLDRGVPRLGENDELYGYIGSVIDITERREAEERLKQKELTLREAQRVAKIGNWEYTVATGSVHWSEEVFRIYGVPPGAGVPAAGRMAGFYHPDDYPGYERTALRSIAHAEPYDTDVRIITPGGAPKYVNIIARPVRGKEGGVYKVYGTVMDITDRKLAENTLQLRNEELQKINHQLDNFVYRAGHDLRAPLVSILGLIQIAQMEPSAPQKDAYMDLMQRSVQKLDAFIQDIIHYSRNVRTEVKKERVDLNQLVGEVVENLQYMKTFPVDITVAADEPVPFHSDPKRLSVILHNLLSNAIRYASRRRPHSWIRITVCTCAAEARITVADNGVGIGPEHLSRIFDMFYRANESSPGSGLGLYIVQEIVQTLGGSIRVESTPDEGTAFTVLIPNLEPTK